MEAKICQEVNFDPILFMEKKKNICIFVLVCYAPLHEKDNEKFSECVVCKRLWCNVHLVNNATGAQGAHCMLNSNKPFQS